MKKLRDYLNRHELERSNTAGDFTTNWRVIPVSFLAVCIGAVAAGVAWLLLRLIGLATNLFYYHRLSSTLLSPADNQLGYWAVLVPVAGGLIIGLMARYGSERIRGHGIPEAIESILINGSKVHPKLAILKPISSAISIGSGGPFGAEGPIIMTGGAFGSMIAQLFHLTSIERRTLLVAGAAAGMSATFAAPLSAVLLAVELLLFEWKPRSAIPVALASATAGALRRYILGVGPLFHVPAHPVFIGPEGLVGCVIAGLLAGALSALLTVAVYAAEDAFHNLKLHWMWWPALGGIAIGLGGLIFPQALGIGFDTIEQFLQSDAPIGVIAGVLLVKSAIWVIALGSGTSGGVLAPLLMMGAALGGVEGMFLPHAGAGFWPLVSMGAILGGTMRSPFTGVVFAVELTHDVNVILPLLVASFLAHAFTVLTLRRSILTEKIARRGYHLSREYALDPLEILVAKDVLRSNVVALQPDQRIDTLVRTPKHQGQYLYPVVSVDGRLLGVVTRKQLARAAEQGRPATATQMMRQPVATAYADEPLRVIVFRMAERGVTRVPVLSREEDRKLLGMLSLDDLLHARTRVLTEERDRERVIRIKLPFQREPEKAPTG